MTFTGCYDLCQNNRMKAILPLTILIIISCNNNTPEEDLERQAFSESASSVAGFANFVVGKDYLIYKRVRLTDNTGFSAPVEAYSALIPEGWSYTGDIIWEQPGSACMGTFRKFSTEDPSGKMKLTLYPETIYSWATNEMLRAHNRDGRQSEYCMQKQPFDASEYLKEIFLPELGSPKPVYTEEVSGVVEEMRRKFNAQAAELKTYGAGNLNFHPTSVKAGVEWADGRKGIITVSVGITEIIVPNQYTGGYDMLYTTAVSNKSVFIYPADESGAEKMYTVIMGGFRTNPYWENSVNIFWKDVRINKQIRHIGTIKAMDAQTARMGRDAIARGNQRLADMDNQLRSWEQKQQVQDRMHTEFIKTIREVENYADETGKYEMAAGYSHAWSRNDGTSFILSDNPNFDPSSVFRDQRWKEMKKVR